MLSLLLTALAAGIMSYVWALIGKRMRWVVVCRCPESRHGEGSEHGFVCGHMMWICVGVRNANVHCRRVVMAVCYA